MKKLFTLLLCAVLLFALSACGDTLDGDDKIAYELIANNPYFQETTQIKVLSGCVIKDPVEADHSALLTMSFTIDGKEISSFFRVKKNSVTNIQMEINQITPEDRNYIGLKHQIQLAQSDQVDYLAITEKLNQRRSSR